MLLLVLTGCAASSERPGRRSRRSGRVDVDTPALRQARKPQAGVEPCRPGTSPAPSCPRSPCRASAAARTSTSHRLQGPLVINLFAQWCGPCRDELPLLPAAAPQGQGRGRRARRRLPRHPAQGRRSSCQGHRRHVPAARRPRWRPASAASGSAACPASCCRRRRQGRPCSSGRSAPTPSSATWCSNSSTYAFLPEQKACDRSVGSPRVRRRPPPCRLPAWLEPVRRAADDITADELTQLRAAGGRRAPARARC